MSERIFYPNVGDFVTVLGWIGSDDNSWKGATLEVLAIDAPYLVVRDLTMRFTLDTRRVTLMRLSADYVAALKVEP